MRRKGQILSIVLATVMAMASIGTGCGSGAGTSSGTTSGTVSETASTAASAGTASTTSASSDKASSSATASSSGKSVTIKWLSQGTGETSWEGMTKPILEEYEKETGVHVDTEFYSFNDLFQVLETKASAGSSDFDVCSVDVTYVSKYGSSGYLEPLDSYFTDDEKAKWDKASYSAGVWDNVMYAAPENTSTQELYYNKTLLDKAGITVPDNDADNRLTYEQVADWQNRRSRN